MPAFVRATGQPVEVVYDSTARLLERINAGAQPAIFLGLSGSLGRTQPPRGGAFHAAAHIVSSGIGVAAAPDANAPSITTVEELAFALTRCRSVAYSRTRPSGTYFGRMLQDLGIADIVNSRATFVEEGSTTSALIDGRAVLAVQQISELKLVPEVTFLGPLPAAVQRYTEFSTYLCSKAANENVATALFNFLGSSLARSAYSAAGLQAY
ncbi:hypothetical protein AA310_01610 [Arthrobacter sp. YC-RL1]|nr:hypothetical protein AA310_01610 [Arthrobacter sp. YC-RL1]